jgi:hypothetical protein
MNQEKQQISFKKCPNNRDDKDSIRRRDIPIRHSSILCRNITRQPRLPPRRNMPVDMLSGERPQHSAA